MKNPINLRRDLWNNRTLLLMSAPAVLFFLIFAYLPMPGLYLAFINYNYKAGMFGSDFVGLSNFRFLWLSGDLWNITKNTILYNLAFIFVGNIIQITVAIILSELPGIRFRKVTQSIMFLPYFVSYVLIGAFVYGFFDYNFGTLNNLLQSLHMEKADMYANTGIWPYIVVFFYLWKNAGYNSIVYFAVIVGISPEYYEAASIDGANILKKIRYITLPMLKPTFIIFLLFSLGSILRGQFDLFYNIIGGASNLYETTDIIETFVFRALRKNFNFSLGSAVGLYQSVFGFITVMVCNFVVKKIEKDYALF